MGTQLNIKSENAYRSAPRSSELTGESLRRSCQRLFANRRIGKRKPTPTMNAFAGSAR